MSIFSQEDVKYVEIAMREFNLVSKNDLEKRKKNSGDPIIKMEIMLDSSEMRPKKFQGADD